MVRLKIVGSKYWQLGENRRKPKSGDGGDKSKLATRSGVRFYLAKEFLREGGRDLGPARRLKKDTNSAGP